MRKKKRSEVDATLVHQDIFNKENEELVSPNSTSAKKDTTDSLPLSLISFLTSSIADSKSFRNFVRKRERDGLLLAEVGCLNSEALRSAVPFIFSAISNAENQNLY